MTHDDVELISMDDQIALPVCAGMDGPFANVYAAKPERCEFAKEFIVIARYINDARALARAVEQMLNDPVAGRRPVPALLQLPPIDEIADQIDAVGLDRLQKIQQCARLGAAHTQMRIADKQSAQLKWFLCGMHRPYRKAVGSRLFECLICATLL